MQIRIDPSHKIQNLTTQTHKRHERYRKMNQQLEQVLLLSVFLCFTLLISQTTVTTAFTNAQSTTLRLHDVQSKLLNRAGPRQPRTATILNFKNEEYSFEYMNANGNVIETSYSVGERDQPNEDEEYIWDALKSTTASAGNSYSQMLVRK